MGTVIDRIVDNSDKELSVVLWNQLIHAFETRSGYGKQPVIGGVYEYFYRTDYYKTFEGFGANWLRGCEWIFDRNGNPKSAEELSIQDLANGYDIDSEAAKRLLSFLKIKDEHPEYENLDYDLRQKVEAYDFMAGIGLMDLPPEKLQQVQQYIKSLQEQPVENDKKNENSTAGNEESKEDKIIKDIQDRVKKKKEKEHEKGEDESNDDAPLSCLDRCQYVELPS